MSVVDYAKELFKFLQKSPRSTKKECIMKLGWDSRTFDKARSFLQRRRIIVGAWISDPNHVKLDYKVYEVADTRFSTDMFTAEFE